MSKSNKGREIAVLLFPIEKGKVADLKGKAILDHLQKASKTSKEEAKDLWEAALLGEADIGNLYDKDKSPPKEMVRLEKALKVIHEAIQWHDKETDRREKQAAKEAEDAKKEGEKLMLKALQGQELGSKVLPNIQGDIQQGLDRLFKKKIQLDGLGLKIEEGFAPDKPEAGMLITYLLGNKQGLDEAESSNAWALGDAAVELEKLFGTDETCDIISMVAVKARQDPAVMLKKWKNAKRCPREDRVEGLSETHHYEAYLYTSEDPKSKKPRLTKGQVHKALEKAALGDLVIETENGNGDKKEHRTPWSCRQLRDYLNELVGKKKPSAEEDKEEEDGDEESSASVPAATSFDPGYYYNGQEHGFFHCPRLFKKALEQGMLAIDIKANVFLTLDKKGNVVEDSKIEPLPKEFWDAEPEAEKPKGKKTKKAKEEVAKDIELPE